EPSGDQLAAELVQALAGSARAGGASFFGAGGSKMAAAGVELAFDLTEHAVVGVVEVLRNYGKFRRLLEALVGLALDRRPDVIVCVDFSGFNRRFASKLRWEREVNGKVRGSWTPKIIQYVSPQVWASRPGRARSMARDLDLLLAIFPFEKQWYAERVPALRVEFVGHPIVDRYTTSATSSPMSAGSASRVGAQSLLLLPGSRAAEVQRHLPVMLGALERIQSSKPEVGACMVLPTH